MQPFVLLAYAMKYLPHVFSPNYTVEWIPVRRRPGNFLRVLMFQPISSSTVTSGKKQPLHIDIHGGAFIGGIPEYDVPFCTQLVQRTGAIVLSISYRHAPRYTFPEAHEDAEDVVKYVIRNEALECGPWYFDAEQLFRRTNLAFSLARSLGRDVVKGMVTFYAPVESSSIAKH